MIKQLMGGLVASAALASPVIAQGSFTELRREYNMLSEEKVVDKILTSEEIKDLRDYLAENLKKLEENPVENEKIISQKLEKLDQLKKFYPGLFDNKVNLIYLTDKEIPKEHTAALKELMTELPKQELISLTEKENFTIEDLVKIYSDYNIDLDKLRSIRSYMEERDAQLFLNSKLSNLTSYLTKKEEIDKSFFNDKRCVSFGFITWLLAHDEYDYFEAQTKIITEDFTQLTKKEFRASTFEETFPDYLLVDTKRKILGILLSAFLPSIVRLLTKIYRKDKFTNPEVGYHATDGVFNSLFGLDTVIHPLFFYARLAGPVIYDVIKGVRK